MVQNVIDGAWESMPENSLLIVSAVAPAKSPRMFRKQ